MKGKICFSRIKLNEVGNSIDEKIMSKLLKQNKRMKSTSIENSSVVRLGSWIVGSFDYS